MNNELQWYFLFEQKIKILNRFNLLDKYPGLLAKKNWNPSAELSRELKNNNRQRIKYREYSSQKYKNQKETLMSSQSLVFSSSIIYQKRGHFIVVDFTF